MHLTPLFVKLQVKILHFNEVFYRGSCKNHEYIIFASTICDYIALRSISGYRKLYLVVTSTLLPGHATRVALCKNSRYKEYFCKKLYIQNNSGINFNNCFAAFPLWDISFFSDSLNSAIDRLN